MHKAIFNPTRILVNETRQLRALNGLFNWPEACQRLPACLSRKVPGGVNIKRSAAWVSAGLTIRGGDYLPPDAAE
jgi:hypothetical protein